MLLIAFIPIVKFLPGTGWVSSPWDTLLFSVLLIVVIPLANGVLTEVPAMLILVRVANRTAGWFAPEKQA